MKIRHMVLISTLVTGTAQALSISTVVGDQSETSEQMRVEADHRANEALYLGDLIATRGG